MSKSTITIEVPEQIERQLEIAWGNNDFDRPIKEAVVLEGYRTQALSTGQVAELLGLSVVATEALLKERSAYLHYSEDDLENDRRTLEQLLGKGRIRPHLGITSDVCL